MLTKRLVVFLSIVASYCGSLSAQEVSKQWFIESMAGTWEVQEEGRPARLMSGKYEVLTPACRVRCLELPCELSYSVDSGHGKEVKPMPWLQPAKRRLKQWLPVPTPTDPPVAPTSTEVQQIIGKPFARGGTWKNSPACTGMLPLLRPSCGETIDLEDFRLQWTPPPAEAGKLFTLFAGGMDSSERKRWNSIPADAGTFRDESLRAYLTDLQLPDQATDVTIRLMRTETLDAVRLLRLPSRADDAEYRKRLKTISVWPALSRNLELLALYLSRGMWSKAADVSRELLRDAPDSLEIRKYALVGFCRSDFADDVARLRHSLKDDGVTGFCNPEGAQ
jgi:hypothetical protein